MTDKMIQLLLSGIGETLYMVIVSTVVAYVFGIPLGVIMYITDKKGICRNRVINLVVGIIINIIRSFLLWIKRI